MKRLFTLLSMACLLGLASNAMAQINARMLQQPDVSQSQIAFSYAGDIWVVSRDGGSAHRLTSAKGEESFPRFSPDGSFIAYNANYDGNTDIYVIPAKGGIPKRITHHPMAERVLGWYPDGKSILFASGMKSGRQRYNQFYKVSKDGGLPEKLPVPYGEFGAISPDGKTIAYTPKSRAFRTWKRYRGGWAPDIHLFNLQTKASENITHNDANDGLPMWHGNMLYFLSDRGDNLRNNIWMYDTKSGATKQITHFKEYDIHFPSIGPDALVFEDGGNLYLMDTQSNQPQKVAVTVETDEMTLKPHTENVSDNIQNAFLSPSGKRVLVQARGDIFSIPAEHGYIQNLTRSSGVAERYPAWSPDGKYVAYWSDRSGEYELTVRDEQGDGKEQKLTSTGKKFKYRISWSPDSKKIVYVDNAMNICMYDMAKKSLTTIDKGLWLYEGGLENFSVSWSADSKWVAYSRGLDNRRSAVFLYNVDNGKSTQVTSGYYNDSNPAFDPDGNYLYFLSSRSLSPDYSDLDDTWIYANSTNIMAVPLRADVQSPIAPRNDSLEVKSESQPQDKKKDDKEATKAVNITLAHFEERAVTLPVDAGNFGNLNAVSGKVLYERAPRTGSADHSGSVVYYDLKDRKEHTVIDKINGYQLSADGKKVLVYSPNKFAVIDLKPDQKFKDPLPTDNLEMTIDPRAEWNEIYTDAWRMDRDFFYDPNMHGVNWNKMRTQYHALLDDAVTRSDVNYVIGELISELSSSHTYKGGGDIEQPDRRGTGLLGVDWELHDGAYRIKKIIDGAPWDSEVRSPLSRPGVDVKEGDYVLAVNGIPLDTSEDPWAAFEGLANKTVQLTINSKPSMDGAHKVIVKTLGSENRLRHLAWIEANRKYVEEASNGQLGYIYVPDTGVGGQTELVRQFVAQFDKKGLVIDERFNSGGQIPDRFVELLDRPELAYWAVRDGKDWQHSPVANFGPKAMLINGWSGSGGDAFPAFFKELKIGPLIGTRTWGGLIGYTGVPSFIDGGTITVPSFRMYFPNGDWFPEGHGIEPDIKVEDDPTKLANGTDPQLDKAIEVVMQQVKEHPYKKPSRPPYQDRSAKGLQH